MTPPRSRLFKEGLHLFRQSSAVAFAAAALLVSPGAEAKQKPATAALSGHTVHGFEPDGEYYDYYAPDGSASSMLNGGDVTHGRWWMQEGQLCVSYPGDTTTCYAMQSDGSQITLTDPNGTVLSGQILRGNPKGI